jgi:hypothetical protein
MDEPALLYCTLHRAARHCNVLYSACIVLCPERHAIVVTIVMYCTLPRVAHHCNYNVGPSEQHLCDSVSFRRQDRVGHHASLHLEPCCTQADSHSGRRCWDVQVRVSNSSACQEPQSTIRMCSNELLLCFTVIVFNFFLNPMLRHCGGRAMSPPSCMAETCSSTTGEELPTSCATRRVRYR